MIQVVTPRQYTADDLLVIPEAHRFELIDGALVERDMGAESSLIGGQLFRLVGNYVAPQKLGHMFTSECGYQIFPDPNRVRYADGSFIARGRLPGEKPPKGHVCIPPDMAFEVVSPNDLAEAVEAKVVEYLQAGVRLLWVVYPASQTVYVYRAGGSVSRLTRGQELTGEDVIPGFVCRVEDLFTDI
jgi:Uma2 family endonuclease